MYKIKGASAEALITIDDLDPEALTQLYGLLNAKASEGSRVAIMPDGHPGKDCLVGFTQTFKEDAEVRLVPNFVGGDIACGVFAWPIGKDAPDLAALDSFIKRHIPNGSRGYADSVNRSAPHGAGRLMSRSEAKELLDIESVRATLGGLFTTTVDSSLDEAPDAYKSFGFIREHITPTADVVDRLTPMSVTGK